MIKKLRIRFILITMLSLIFVLGIIITIVNFVSFKNVDNYADDILEILQKNDGDFTGVDFSHDKNNQESQNDTFKPSEEMTHETPYETRFFTISYNEDGTINKINIAHIAIDIEDAIYLGDSVLNYKKSKGTINTYRYLKDNDSATIYFVDISRLQKNSKLFLRNGIIVSLSGTFVVFIMIFFISKKVAASFVKNYEKQKRFITDAGHELKTPLTIISANNELVEMQYGENDFTKAINKQIIRMTGMVKNLTELAKLDEKEKLDSLVDFSLSETINDVAFNFKNAFAKENKKIILDIQENITFKGNEKCIRELLSVLLDNALKYSNSMCLLTFKKNKDLILTIKNDSTHILKGDHNDLFERFYRLSDDRGNIEGSGIGLSIAKEIVALHHGKISAYSEKDNEFMIKVVL